MINKKGDAMTLNIIIVAVLALTVLVILLMIFTGRITLFDQGVSKEAQTDLVALRITYGECQPTASQESVFSTAFGQATSPDEKEQAKTNFKGEISRCKVYSDKGGCEGASCLWD